MAIKESTDELTSDVVTEAAISSKPRRKTAADYLALAISTCGVGYFPIAPGTMGSLVGVGLYLTLWAASYRVLEANVFARRLTLMHVWTPQIVVIDEVAGQMIALLSGPFWLHTAWSIVTAFLLFRAFDIWKPYPIRKLEGLESGLGIMADDLAAGAYALIVNSVLISAYLLLFPASG
jgi:phosphatidylglycerophosphatase A